MLKNIRVREKSVDPTCVEMLPEVPELVLLAYKVLRVLNITTYIDFD